MTDKLSIIVPCFNRADVLPWGLESIKRQTITTDYEVVVINDGFQDETEAICNKFSESMNIKYLFSGQRNVGGVPVWRVPSVAINAGVKASTGTILMLTCPEIYHEGNIIQPLINAVVQNRKCRAIPKPGLKDGEKAILNALIENNGVINVNDYANRCTKLDTNFPFCMVLAKDAFMYMGGYDEDFENGITGDDDDFISRLHRMGMSGFTSDVGTLVHLWHPTVQWDQTKRDRNMKLFHERLSANVVRNVGKEWGKI